jgi:hypothetical protein
MSTEVPDPTILWDKDDDEGKLEAPSLESIREASAQRRKLMENFGKRRPTSTV